MARIVGFGVSKSVQNVVDMWRDVDGIYAASYKHADGKKIDGRRVLVDVERGRTVKGWQPRRLGQYY